MTVAAPTAGPTPRPLRRVEFRSLVESGAFDREHVELIRGRLMAMSPQSTDHRFTVHALVKRLTLALGERAEVMCQAPFRAAGESEPEPDLLVVPPGRYDDEHPREAWLIVEVASSSLAYDRDVKGPLYAESGVPHYWLVDLAARTVSCFSRPAGGAYASSERRGVGEQLEVPEPLGPFSLAVDEILP